MTEKYNCIIIDDEQLAIDHLTHFLRELYPNIEVTRTFTSWSIAQRDLSKCSPDILFLDISMQGRNGMDLLRIHSHLNCETVFVTAHAEYALEAFKLAASAYLLKPFDVTELTKVINRILLRISDRRKALSNCDPAVTDLKSSKLAVPSNNSICYVETRDIIFLEGVGGYTRVVFLQGEVLSSYRLGEFSSKLEPIGFRQVHRSYLVNLAHAVRYETSGVLVLAKSFEIPVSRSYRDGVLNMFLTIR